MANRPAPTLVLVDLQRDFFPGGSLPVPLAERIIEPVNRLLAIYEQPIITQDWHPPGHISFASSHPGCSVGDWVALPHGSQQLWPDHCVAGSSGAQIEPRIRLPPDVRYVRKGTRPSMDSYSAFFEDDGVTPAGLHDMLQERSATAIVVAGLATDFCVLATVLDACRLGYKVSISEAACEGIDIDGSLEHAWAQMKAAGARRI